MHRIVFATANAGKLKEIHQILQDTGLEIISMAEAGVDTDIVEDGSTFEENALIKARTVAAHTDGVVIADDSGLCVDALQGEPGVYSARYLGEDTPYEEKNAKIIERLSGVKKEDRTARFVCAMAIIFPDKSEKVVKGIIEGYIGYEPVGENGFGYDPIFYVDDLGTSTANISPEEKNAISHRGKALRMIREELKSHADTGLK